MSVIRLSDLAKFYPQFCSRLRDSLLHSCYIFRTVAALSPIIKEEGWSEFEQRDKRAYLLLASRVAIWRIADAHPKRDGRQEQYEKGGNV